MTNRYHAFFDPTIPPLNADPDPETSAPEKW